MILITGATGNIGGKVVRELLVRGLRPRVVARDPRRAEGLARQGVEVVAGDFDQPESLRPALRGVERVFLMTPSIPEQSQVQGRFAALAREAGVQHIVRLSGARARPDHPARVYRWHHQAEQLIRGAGLALTSVRPVYFMQNLVSFHLGQSLRAQGRWVGPMAPEFAFNLIDTRDIAAVIAACLTQPGHEGKEYDITGPECLSSAAQAARLSAALGRPISYVPMPAEAFKQMMMAGGQSASLAETVLEIHQHLDTFTNNVVEQVTGRPPFTFHQFLKAHAHELRPPQAPRRKAASRPPPAGRTTSPLRVLVTGATGRQGGATARALLQAGHRVRALTRRPEVAPAQELAALGAELVRGDFEDPASLSRALEGTEALFAVSTPFESEQGPAAELRQGRALVDAAKAAGVGHVVFTSAANADRGTGIPHFESKYEVERYLIASGLPYTVLAPASFMENLLTPMRLPALQQGVVASPLPAGCKVKQISVEDIGRFAALVLERREQFSGHRVDLAADDSSGEEMAEILSRVLGRPMRCSVLPRALLQVQGSSMARAFEFLESRGYEVDVATLRREYPEVGWQDFEAWARSLEWGPLLG
jgi:uncharacterized protein YbjT (DUF2867 family)